MYLQLTGPTGSGKTTVFPTLYYWVGEDDTRFVFCSSTYSAVLDAFQGQTVCIGCDDQSTWPGSAGVTQSGLKAIQQFTATEIQLTSKSGPRVFHGSIVAAVNQLITHADKPKPGTMTTPQLNAILGRCLAWTWSKREDTGELREKFQETLTVSCMWFLPT